MNLCGDFTLYDHSCCAFALLSPPRLLSALVPSVPIETLMNHDYELQIPIRGFLKETKRVCSFDAFHYCDDSVRYVETSDRDHYMFHLLTKKRRDELFTSS